MIGGGPHWGGFYAKLDTKANAFHAGDAEPRLDPSHPGAVSEGDWKEFPSYLYFPRAGCYALRARWPGGEWDLGFGFGR